MICLASLCKGMAEGLTRDNEKTKFIKRYRRHEIVEIHDRQYYEGLRLEEKVMPNLLIEPAVRIELSSKFQQNQPR